MFSIFKSKYYLQDLIPNNYIDIHNHLLPGIDDGAKSVAETSTLIARMKEINIAGAIATPHTYTSRWNNSTSSIESAYDYVKETSLNGCFLKGYASEYMLDSSLMERIKKEKLLCIKDSFVLVELHLFNNPIDLYELLFQLKIKDYKIIIAHPERYLYFHHDFQKLIKLKAFDVYFQLNLLSLTGYYGTEIQKMAEKLLENDMYDFSGTDVHNEKHIDLLIKKPIPFSKKNKIGDLLQKNSFFS
ncbi:tyrosine-protein phosphatase [Flavobacterium cellulosilyticum]|uniref:protein-tyrosine-phosphatase n=1 Tax=Flavobacterium cellulosilyticum TaxID=2541731 RepID=A0A4R5C5P6_9FLAO|nr:CpsB/CapC family capsule biosynthesis tyrosine phosphatase [Flavobacterium cellulosilyticum]TDD95081.1 histidinol phosphatase [Flavobacterium cellulosilyticum]